MTHRELEPNHRPRRTALLMAALLAGSILACGDDPPAKVQEIEEDLVGAVHSIECDVLFDIDANDGYDVPGFSGQPRFGMPGDEAPQVRVRRSFSSLDDAEKKQVADAFLKLKQTPYEYPSLCDELGLGSYTHNMYDYFVEAHTSAFVSMNTPYMSHAQMPHMGPQFIPWHRYLLLRLESQMRQVLGDPEFTLPYWDWEDCGGRDEDDPDANPCPEIFDPNFMGSPGTCDDATVTGYLVDNGFQNQIFTTAGIDAFKTGSISCGVRALQRQVGCDDLAPMPAQTTDIDDMFLRTVYDAEPYDSCDTDENVSFRQYLEGFTRNDTNPICVAGGCQMHGRGHVYISGDMANGGAAPNDPMFFLHHTNVDRLWAEWQAANVAAGRDTDHGNPEFPDDWRGSLFVWNEVDAEEMFDHRALGFTYDTLAQ